MLRQLDLGQPEIIDAPDEVIKGVPLRGFPEVAIGLKLIADQNIGVGLRTAQNDRRYHFEGYVTLDKSQNLAAVHLRKIEIEQDKVRARGLKVDALPPEKGHGLQAIGSQVQTDRPVDVDECLPRQPGIAGIILDQEN